MTRRRARARRGRPSPIALLASLACLAAGGVAVRLARDEALAVVITQAVEARSATARDAALAAYGDRAPAQLPPRALAPLAQLAITAAQSAPSPALRALNAARARAMVDRLRAVRPGWDVTCLLTAQLALVDHPGGTPLAVAAVAKSYRLRPFCAPCAAWRVAFARIYWPALDAATRTAAVEEAVWQTRFDGGRRDGYQRLLGDSPAGVAYQLRLSDIGHGATSAASR